MTSGYVDRKIDRVKSVIARYKGPHWNRIQQESGTCPDRTVLVEEVVRQPEQQQGSQVANTGVFYLMFIELDFQQSFPHWEQANFLSVNFTED